MPVYSCIWGYIHDTTYIHTIYTDYTYMCWDAVDSRI